MLVAFEDDQGNTVTIASDSGEVAIKARTKLTLKAPQIVLEASRVEVHGTLVEIESIFDAVRSRLRDGHHNQDRRRDQSTAIVRRTQHSHLPRWLPASKELELGDLFGDLLRRASRIGVEPIGATDTGVA